MRACTHPADHLQLLFEARDYVTGDRFEVRRCRNCGLALTVPPPAPGELGRYYPAGYHGGGTARRFPALVEALQAALYRRRARSVQVLARRPGRVLDIGCGRGWFLQAFRRRGWNVQGTELSEDSARHAREALRLPVEIGPSTRLPWADGHFDAAVLWHVLEHLPDPGLALREAARVLRPGGVLLVGVPNFGSCEARLGRDRWFHLDVPRHLAHFTGPVLRQALAESGMVVRRTSFLAPEYDCFSFTQTALNRLGLRHNLLYNLLRGRGAKVLDSGEAGCGQIAATLLLAAPIGMVSVPWTLLAGWLGQGATMTIWAVKEG